MKFARWVFLIAGIYGIIIVAPMYFFENMISRDYPPAITHPEFYYGFLGVTLAWQVLFILLSRDPVKHRLFMLPAILEKATYGPAVMWLYAQGRVASFFVGGAVIDMIFGVLFVAAFIKTGKDTA